eukprot:GEZU01009841.1.p1 GENE.GEZU01009841.1~~GEZU01009841.1.p1  ORF type:complete len:223 (-),score=0.24 GEZU01009841.1:15-659(-)
MGAGASSYKGRAFASSEAEIGEGKDISEDILTHRDDTDSSLQLKSVNSASFFVPPRSTSGGHLANAVLTSEAELQPRPDPSENMDVGQLRVACVYDKTILSKLVSTKDSNTSGETIDTFYHVRRPFTLSNLYVNIARVVGVKQDEILFISYDDPEGPRVVSDEFPMDRTYYAHLSTPVIGFNFGGGEGAEADSEAAGQWRERVLVFSPTKKTRS